MIFKQTQFNLKTLNLISKSFFGSHAHKVTNVIQTKNNPQRLKQLRGQQQLQLHMSQYAKQFFYIHKKQRKPLSLYNIFSYLPTSITNQIAKLVSEPKVQLASDQIYMPKISQNGVSVYQSFGTFASTLRTINKLVIGLPVFALATAHMPYIAVTAMVLHYFVYFKSTYSKATERFVIKMELLPQTQELIFQKINKTGNIKTVRARTNDIQIVDPDNDAKYRRDLVFERSLNSVLDMNMVYRIKSTGQILMFDRQGVWHQQGLNHQLMP